MLLTFAHLFIFCLVIIFLYATLIAFIYLVTDFFQQKTTAIDFNVPQFILLQLCICVYILSHFDRSKVIFQGVLFAYVFSGIVAYLLLSIIHRHFLESLKYILILIFFIFFVLLLFYIYLKIVGIFIKDINFQVIIAWYTFFPFLGMTVYFIVKLSKYSMKLNKMLNFLRNSYIIYIKNRKKK